MLFRKIIIQENTNIEYKSPELLFLGSSGQPYRGTIYVNFQSKGETFDLRDFKKYITSLRDKTFHAEDIAYEIFRTINENILTENLGIVVDLSARGGVGQRISYGNSFIPTKKETIFQI